MSQPLRNAPEKRTWFDYLIIVLVTLEMAPVLAWGFRRFFWLVIGKPH